MSYGGEKRPTRDPANLQKALEIRGLAASAKVFLGSHECVVADAVSANRSLSALYCAFVRCFALFPLLRTRFLGRKRLQPTRIPRKIKHLSGNQNISRSP